MGEIRSDLQEKRVFEPSEHFQKNARLNSLADYDALYRRSVESPDEFWAEQAEKNLEFFRRWDSVFEYHPARIGASSDPYLTFLQGAQLNVSYNCLDRHVKGERRNKAAILWQGEREEDTRSLTYLELYEEVCRCANTLKALGVEKGTRVTLFMPMIPETAVALLACARIGAIHSVVFSAFSRDALRSRIQDCGSSVVITADFSVHGGKKIALKENVDFATEECPTVRHVLVVKNGSVGDGSEASMTPVRDLWWHETVAHAAPECAPEAMDAEAPLFILYTSGSTGKPKGVLHTTAGYSLYAHLTFQYVFDIQEEDVFWCTADVGWITGHSYLIYGPLSNGATCVMFEGVPTYPEPDRFWRTIEKHRVTIFYTAPTAIRALMRLGEEWPNRSDLSSLRLIGTVGEPINPEAWIWYHRVIGRERCPVVDTWWQTETGGIMITTLPGAIAAKPGCAGKPFFGIVPEVLREDGTPTAPNEGGGLFIKNPWPGMLRGVFGDERSELIQKVYFSRHPEKYFSGDGCRIDEDGYYWLLGRIDDVINVSAHRFATAEIESALVSHPAVAEAAVVGFPHDIKGQGIYCYVTVKHGRETTEELLRELIHHVRREISPIATPDQIHFTPALPKTRSGKIMRRILRKIAEGETGDFGDTSTLADPSVVETLLATRRR